MGFVPVAAKSRNAANAMTAIVCGRLLGGSGHRPLRQRDKTFKWKEGVFACRNIADRDYVWTNVRRNVADSIHDAAERQPAAYLLSCTSPSNTTLSAWAIPEPLVYESLLYLPVKKTGGYSIEIHGETQRFEHYVTSPDLSSFHRRSTLSEDEVRILEESRAIDASVNKDRRSSLIPLLEQKLEEEGAFDPAEIRGGRERILSSIVRRRGQPLFRRRLLEAYGGQCAISGCTLEAVLEAAHIVPYQGPETNDSRNGLLLRADLHTLFDLYLIAIDAASLTVLISPQVAGTCYAGYAGKRIRMPADRERQPSRKALKDHRRKSGL